MKRKEFLSNGMMAGTALIFAPYSGMKSQLNENGPPLNKDLVQTFVGVGHRDMDQVKVMLEEHPTLLNAAHDWQYGDFETCLGAASHVGYKELVHFLIEQGAQANIFTAVLLGRMDIVEPFLSAFPASLNAKGPHGFTLLHHAEKGGDEALEVKEHLLHLGAKETKIALY